jgi:hypothetical protein
MWQPNHVCPCSQGLHCRPLIAGAGCGAVAGHTMNPIQPAAPVTGGAPCGPGDHQLQRCGAYLMQYTAACCAAKRCVEVPRAVLFCKSLLIFALQAVT